MGSSAKMVYLVRHGQVKSEDNPSLTKRGCMQVVEATQKYLRGISFDAIYRGTYIRHAETAAIAKVALGLSCEILETSLLSLTNEINDAANKCANQLREHPNGTSVGFRIDTWFEKSPALMNACKNQFMEFLREIPETTPVILAISSSPLIESAIYNPHRAWLLGECGIARYIIDKSELIVSSEIIFDGFFEKSPQKNQ